MRWKQFSFQAMYKAAYTPGRASAPLMFSCRASSAEYLLFRLSIYTVAKHSRSARHTLRKEVASVVLPRNFHSSSQWRQKRKRCCVLPCWSPEVYCWIQATLNRLQLTYYFYVPLRTRSVSKYLANRIRAPRTCSVYSRVMRRSENLSA